MINTVSLRHILYNNRTSNMNPWDQLSEEKRKQTQQLLEDMLPYYGRIAVYDVDKQFITEHMEQCLRLALAGKETILTHKDLTPEAAIFSDEHFSQLLQEAWASVLSNEDKHFLNDHLQQAAECFRMGFMMADLPEM